MNELYHYGVKGQKHGVRQYQTSNGSWTQLGLERRREREGFGDGEDGSNGNPKGSTKKSASTGQKKENYFARKKRLKQEKLEAIKAKKEAEANETVEQRRSRMLKSTNAQELYKNRDILTTAEINERLNRIDTEAKLARVAASTKKTGMDYVNKFLEYGKKANEVYKLTQEPLGKAIMVKLGLKAPPVSKTVDYEKALLNINRLSNKEVQELAARTINEQRIRDFIEKQMRSNP